MTDEKQKKIFSKNLSNYLNIYGKTQKEVADAIRVSPQTFNTWCQGIALPRMGKVQLLADYFHINKSDLIEEHTQAIVSSPDYTHTSTPEEFEKLIIPYRNLDDFGKKHIDYELERESTRVATLSKKDFRIKELEAINALPPAPRRIYTYLHKIAAAGVGFYFDDIPTDTIEAPYRENADFIVGVNGDSMEPTYSNGDLVYVEKCQIVEPGEIGIFIVNSECFIKEAGHDELISHNKKYKPIPGTEHIICVGRVLGKVNTD